MTEYPRTGSKTSARRLAYQVGVPSGAEKWCHATTAWRCCTLKRSQVELSPEVRCLPEAMEK